MNSIIIASSIRQKIVLVLRWLFFVSLPLLSGFWFITAKAQPFRDRQELPACTDPEVLDWANFTLTRHPEYKPIKADAVVTLGWLNADPQTKLCQGLAPDPFMMRGPYTIKWTIRWNDLGTKYLATFVN